MMKTCFIAVVMLQTENYLEKNLFSFTDSFKKTNKKTTIAEAFIV